jgi:hypothetical protein
VGALSSRPLHYTGQRTMPLTWLSARWGGRSTKSFIDIPHLRYLVCPVPMTSVCVNTTAIVLPSTSKSPTPLMSPTQASGSAGRTHALVTHA